MKGMSQKNECASSPPIMMWAVIRKLVNFISYVFFFTLAALLIERWFGERAVGVYDSFLLTTRNVKGRLLIKS